MKSCAAVEESSLSIGARGVSGDREWMIVGEDGVFLSQRQIPKLAQIQILDVTTDGLTLCLSTQKVRAQVLANKIPALVWRDKVEALSCDDESSRVLSEWLERPVRLVKSLGTRASGDLEFVDQAHVHVISLESVADFSSRLANAIPWNRFRPNLVLEGCAPYEEDGWSRIKIGDVELEHVTKTGRCIMIATDQQTSTVDREPVFKLKEYRSEGSKIVFGVHMRVVRGGTVKVTDRVETVRIPRS